ncbi:hypothetical protein JMA_02760 [Jeotgalibacillus malaysiensis]|uniref:Uncharacterized protein n=1 Tax=Jeotgalibacillus malaysiensis TaxID=1508404 RepID=A0A0B5AM12_9BACL|nr:hypothetical protein JMA_02760 [Jeotgalibacillus malaysiensis]
MLSLNQPKLSIYLYDEGWKMKTQEKFNKPVNEGRLPSTKLCSIKEKQKE